MFVKERAWEDNHRGKRVYENRNRESNRVEELGAWNVTRGINKLNANGFLMISGKPR